MTWWTHVGPCPWLRGCCARAEAVTSGRWHFLKLGTTNDAHLVPQHPGNLAADGAADRWTRYIVIGAPVARRIQAPRASPAGDTTPACGPRVTRCGRPPARLPSCD